MSHAEIIGDLANEPIMETGPDRPIAFLAGHNEGARAGRRWRGGLKKSSQYRSYRGFWTRTGWVRQKQFARG